VEDDDNIRELVIYTLETTGLKARGFADGSAFTEGLEVLEQQNISLAIVDVMMPVMDGITMVLKLREKYDFPVIMLSAKSEDIDKITGLNMGADDYVTKPFGMMELVSRIKAVLRRSKGSQERENPEIQGVHIDVKKHEVTVDGRTVPLTLKEFELLEKLMRNEGIVLTRDQLLTEIWGYDFDGETRTVDVHIRTLRQKLGEKGEIIQTVRGVGYRIGGSA